MSRLRRLRPRTAPMQEIETLMKSIANRQAEVASILTAMGAEEEQLFELMKNNKVPTHAVDDVVAEIVRSAGKSQTLIDPKKFQAKVTAEDFYKCITVSVTKAKEVLPLKVVNLIAKIIPGKSGPEKLVVKRK